MIQQHGKLLQIHHRLKTIVEEQGDHAFATALGACIGNAQGENPHSETCPFRKLLLEDYVKTGMTPKEATTNSNGVSPEGEGPVPVSIPHAVLLKRIQTLLQQDARRLDDQRYLEALLACEAATENNPQCPFSQLRASQSNKK